MAKQDDESGDARVTPWFAWVLKAIPFAAETLRSYQRKPQLFRTANEGTRRAGYWLQLNGLKGQLRDVLSAQSTKTKER